MALDILLVLEMIITLYCIESSFIYLILLHVERATVNQVQYTVYEHLYIMYRVV